MSDEIMNTRFLQFVLIFCIVSPLMGYRPSLQGVHIGISVIFVHPVFLAITVQRIYYVMDECSFQCFAHSITMSLTGFNLKQAFAREKPQVSPIKQRH